MVLMDPQKCWDLANLDACVWDPYAWTHNKQWKTSLLCIGLFVSGHNLTLAICKSGIFFFFFAINIFLYSHL